MTVIYSSLTGYLIMLVIGSALENQAMILPSGHLIGVSGLLLFGIGITAATLSPRTRSASVLSLFIGGMVAFGIAVFLVGFGNWQLSAAFHSLASADTVDAESFIQDAWQGKAPFAYRMDLCTGWGRVNLCR